MARNKIKINGVTEALHDARIPEGIIGAPFGEIPGNINIYVDADKYCVVFTQTSASGSLILTRSTDTDTIGIIAEAFCDFTNGSIGLYSVRKSSQSRNVLSINSFAFTNGHEYVAEFVKVGDGTYNFTVTDIFTGDSASIIGDYEQDVGDGWGKRTYTAVGCTVIDATNTMLQNTSPKLLILGDSFVEGWTLLHDKTEKYAYLIKEKMGMDKVFICGKGGAASADGVTWFTDYISTYIKPKYVLLAFGMNDSNVSTWQSNMQSMISAITSLGAKPIIATITPTSSGSYHNAEHMQMNSWSRSSGYHILDIAKCLTVNHDGTTFDSSKFMADGVHPTKASHKLIYEWATRELSYLFA